MFNIRWASIPRSGLRRGTVWVGVLAVAVSAAACGSSSSSSGSSSSGNSSRSSGGTYVYVSGLVNDPFYISVSKGLTASAKKFGVTVKTEGQTNEGAAASVQAGIARAALATHPKALIISPNDQSASIPPIQQYKNAGIPVVTVDTTVTDTSLLITRITSNNVQGGALAAETIAKDVHYQGEVAVANAPPGVSTTDARLAGFEAQMKKYPKMKIIAVENNNAEIPLAEAQAKSLILSHPKLVAFFGTAVFGGQGSAEAVKADHMQGKIIVVSYDAEPLEVQLLKQGVISGLIIQQPTLEAQLAVKYIHDYLTGKKSLIPKSVTVPNVLATTQDANDPNITKYYYGN